MRTFLSICCLAALWTGRADERNLSALPPAGAIAAVHFAGNAQAGGAFEKSAMGQIVADPQIQAFLKKPKAWFFQQFEKEMTQADGKLFRQLWEITVRRENAAAFYGEGLGKVVWCMKLGDDEAAMRSLLVEVGKSQGGTTERKSGSYSVQRDGGGIETVIAKGVFVLSNDSKRMDETLARLDGAMAREATVSGPKLTAGKTAVWLTVDLPEIVKLARQQAGDAQSKAELDAALAALGLDGLGKVEMAMGFDGATTRTCVRVTLTKAAGGFLEWFLTPQPLDEAAVKLVPKDVASAWVTRMDAGAVWNSTLDAFADASPEMFQEMLGGIAEIEKQLTFNLKGDLIDSMGDTAAFYTRASPGLMQLGDMVLVMSLRDGDKFKSCVEKLTSAAMMMIQAMQGGQVTIKSADVADGQMYQVTGLPMTTPAWMVKGQFFYLAGTPSALERAIAQVEKPQTSLLDNDDFRAARAKLPAKTMTLGYEDTRQSVAGLYAGLGVVSPFLLGQKDLPLDLSLLPPLAQIQGKLFGSATAITADKHAIELHHAGVLPMDMSLYAAMGSLTGAVWLPAIQQARGAGHDACQKQLANIGEACLAYADANDGKFPPQLAALFPKHLATQRTLICPATTAQEGAVTYVYAKGLTKNEAEKILAYDADDNHPDGRNVLFCNGRVERMTESHFQKKLAAQAQ